MDPMLIIFGKSPEIMARALAATAAEGIQAMAAHSVAEVMAVLAQAPDALIAIGGGVPDKERGELGKALATASATVQVIEIYGPGTLVPTVRKAMGLS